MGDYGVVVVLFWLCVCEVSPSKVSPPELQHSIISGGDSFILATSYFTVLGEPKEHEEF